MPVATVPVQLSPDEVSQTQTLKRLVQLMVKQLVLSGSGQFQQQVMDFQKAWNGYAAVFAKVQPSIATPSDVCYRESGRVRHFMLTEDGQYAAKSATALYYLVGPARPPCKASGMAAWYVSNHDRIDALTPPTNYPVDVREQTSGTAAQQQTGTVTDVEIAQAGGTTSQQLREAAVAVADLTQAGGGAATNQAHAVNQDVVQSIVTEPDVAHAAPDAPATKTVTIRDATVNNTVGLIETKIKKLVANGTLPRRELHIVVYGAKLPSLDTVLAKLQADTKAGKIPYLQPAVNVDLREQSVAPPVTPEEHIEESVDTPVLARPRSGRTAAIAVAVGGAALVGVLGWMAFRGKRRRR